MDTQRLYQLFERYAARTASPAEQQELFALVETGSEAELKAALQQLQQATVPDPVFEPARWQPVLDRILATARTLEAEGEELAPEESVTHRLFPWNRFVAAAAVAGVLILGTWLWSSRHPAADTATRQGSPAVKDVPPGGQHAILTLAGGATILLDSARNGQLASQGNTDIVKLDDGRLAYQPGTTSPAATIYNSIATPRGGWYQLRLPDGTRVWLNAASSLRFPTAFIGATREVEMSGEAYFEVAADPAHPFIVHTRETRTTVLGTAFNINAYDDEPALRTTLLEGAVKVSAGAEAKLLHPGQQASYQGAARSLTIRSADTAAAVAWKNGRFPLKGTDMAALMRQIARWYDVDVHFDGPVPDKSFGGSISRNTNLSAVLLALKENGVDCRLNGKTIEVINNKPDP